MVIYVLTSLFSVTIAKYLRLGIYKEVLEAASLSSVVLTIHVVMGEITW